MVDEVGGQSKEKDNCGSSGEKDKNPKKKKKVSLSYKMCAKGLV